MNKLPVKPFLFIAVFSFLLGCTHPAARPVAQKHYPLTGKIVSIDAKERTAAVDAAAVPNFMEAMTMDYPIQSKEEFAKLHPGDHITATIDVGDDGSFALSHIKVVPAASK